MKISVLTPTYNRASFLPKLYQSLLENRSDGVEIEWLIMNDGSTDDTQTVVEEFQKENKIEILYYEQENQGKMVSINQLVTYATGDLIVDCDSDDFFADHAVETIQKAYQQYQDEENIYGLVFLKYNTNGENIGKEMSHQRTTMFDLYFKQGEDGEKIIVFFAGIRKQYQHELEKQEKFITEARMYHKMDEKYQIITINQPVIIGDYQEDGYTQNIQKVFRENPYGYYQYFKEILEKDLRGVPLQKRLYVLKHYVLFSYLTNQYHSKSIKNVSNKIAYFLLWIPGVIKSRKWKNIE